MNKPATAATLKLTEPAIEGVPPLPARPQGRPRRWHALVEDWWQALWESPLSEFVIQLDIHGLYMLADLKDRYWREPNTQLAAEIGRWEDRYGITPAGRWRYGLKFDRGNGKPPSNATAPSEPMADPRRNLTLVKGA